MSVAVEPEPPRRFGRRALRAGASKPAGAPAVADFPRPLGRIADFEAHVRPDWWRAIFDDLYLKTDGDVFENDGNTRADVEAVIDAIALEPDDRVLDLCCGQGRHSLELARRGFRDVTGIDLSHFLIDLARRRARDGDLRIDFLEGDARWSGGEPGQYDAAVILGNSFGYFAGAEDDAALLRNARRLLRPGGRLALDLVDGDWLRQNFEPRSWEWLDTRSLVCRERALSADGDRLITREIVMKIEGGVAADRFFAERLYGRARISALLEELGFEAVGVRELADAQSDGAGDLGMMARRVLVTARAAGGCREVAVVMGDPRRPDKVKPGGGFGAAERETAVALRAALARLEDYRFRFITDHGSLVSSLQSRRPDLVLNLCDEGYNNDALLEAHIPAMLDVLGIPYTGAGPACLATCYDKSLVTGMARLIGVPVPREILIGAEDPLTTIAGPLPALIKPCFGDNSVGIDASSVVKTEAQAREALRRLRTLLPGVPLLMQEYLAGAEYSVGVIGNPDQSLEPLPILEVDYSGLDRKLPPILAYASKWDPRSPYSTQIRYTRATLPAVAEGRLVEQVTRLFRRLGCRDYVRVDFRADAQGEIKLLEVNPNPGWCWDGKLNKMAALAGIDYAGLLRRILEAAERRIAATPAPGA
jgi:D-alanine-D-alanine ligase